jgi:hypothetical protein
MGSPGMKKPAHGGSRGFRFGTLSQDQARGEQAMNWIVAISIIMLVVGFGNYLSSIKRTLDDIKDELASLRSIAMSQKRDD